MANSRSLATLTLSLVFLSGLVTEAAEIRGTITGDDGNPLSGIPVCLGRPGITGCMRIESTNSQGQYAFGNVFTTAQHTVKVLSQDPTTACYPAGSSAPAAVAPGREARINTRQHFAHSHLVWTPESADVQISSGFDSITANFNGVFGFSNYRPALCLTGASFPELDEFDAATDALFLKLYIWSGDDLNEQELLYLGQLSNPDYLRIEVSVPHSVVELHYDIYSVSGAVSGVYRLERTAPTGQKPPSGGKMRRTNKGTR